MTKKEKFEKWLSENSLTILFFILLTALISIALVIGIYATYFRGFPVATNAAPWGQFGDFFGGTLNPIFGFLSVMALLAALVIQSRELKVSSEELRNSALALNAQNKAIANQSFEQTFFSWLDNYRDMLGSIEYVLPSAEGGRELSGRRVLRRWWIKSLERDQFIGVIAQSADGYKLLRDSGDTDEIIFNKVLIDSPNLLTDEAFKQWEKIYRENEYQLDSLFRNLYRLILWIDSQHQDRMDTAQKWFYTSIVRAQLSWIEMVYLFYNGYTERGRKFKRLVEKYALFDNLNFDSDPVISHIKKHQPEGNHYANTAYDSPMARKELGLPESTEEMLTEAVVV